MAYRRTVRRGMGMLPGYQIIGACDPVTGAATGNPSTYANVRNPDGSLKCYGPTDPAYLALLGTPSTPAGPVPLSMTPPTVTPQAMMPNSPPVIDCATQAAQLAALKAQAIANGGTWNFPAGQGPFGPLPACTNTTAPSGLNSNLIIWIAAAAGAAILLPGAMKAAAIIPAYAAYNVSQGNAPFFGLGLMA